LANTPVTFSSCAHSLNGRNVVAGGTLMASGTWTASEPASPVRLSGDLTVNDIGIIAIDSATGSNFIGAVGGISIGVADTPPPPFLTTTGAVFSLVATSNTAMSGQVSTTATAVCSGSQQFCPPPVTTGSNSSVSLVKQ
jgi:hypothetical protein